MSCINNYILKIVKHKRNFSFIKILSVVILSNFFAGTVFSQYKDCSSKQIKDTLIIENNLIRRRFLWKNGALVHLDLLNKLTNRLIYGNSGSEIASFSIPGVNAVVDKISIKTYVVAETPITNAYLATEIICQWGELALKRVFRIYPDCPAIACDLFLRGRSSEWANAFKSQVSGKNEMDERSKKSNDSALFITDKIGLTGNHWKLRSVEFFDGTDDTNNLIQTYDRLIYRKDIQLRGNILLAENNQNGESFFILKEAPVSSIQLYYQGFDFRAHFGEVNTVGVGIAPKDLSDSNWVRGYSVVVGVGNGKSKEGLLSGLRTYQQLQRRIVPERDEMIISNTWGDRSQDSRVNEKFILQEIEAASKLGITHLQIDDGWQMGKSANSIISKGRNDKIWLNPNYWKPNLEKFPDGFQKIVDIANEKKIRISLWFNPSSDSSYANWEKDADALIGIYREFGITMFKIDGVSINDKLAETNFRKLLDKVLEATNYHVVFNLDITAGKRGGYHSFTQYGNLFLENRYTDWANYYPYFTLRNIWQLSSYVPPQRFQLEFLNKWRNIAKYPLGDSLSPANYSFDYLFAIAIIAQPLAWFEISSLPKEAFGLKDLIKEYKIHQVALHSGKIFPIGDEPDGYSWTGFQSNNKNEGYFLVFRENSISSKAMLRTWLSPGSVLSITTTIGKGKSYHSTVDKEQKVLFNLEKRNSFTLLKYKIIAVRDKN